MPNKLMLAFLGFDFLFAGCGGLLLGFSLMSEAAMRETQTVANVTQNLLLGQCPLTAGVVNAIFVFVTFLLSLPALFLPTNRGWLRAQGWLVVICATFTLSLGVAIWVETLQTRRNLSVLWGRETPQIQSLLQQKVGLNRWKALYVEMLTSPVRLLRIRQRYHTSFCPGFYMHQRACRGPERWMHWSILFFHQQIP